ncbi:MAG TPA: 30S ribosomal protein S2, partial [Candidatus Nanoperiomorbaceae bacterium]|nr:30S ribosomal protein S2 [Candidatus Nanoperiomorbaceae bacterium]
AVKLGLPVIAICDTNADPTGVTYPIPANDDAISSLSAIADYVVAAVKAGESVAAKKSDDAKKEDK